MVVPFGPLMAWKRGDPFWRGAQRLDGGRLAIRGYWHCGSLCGGRWRFRSWFRFAIGPLRFCHRGAPLTDLVRTNRIAESSGSHCARPRAPAAPSRVFDLGNSILRHIGPGCVTLLGIIWGDAAGAREAQLPKLQGPDRPFSIKSRLGTLNFRKVSAERTRAQLS